MCRRLVYVISFMLVLAFVGISAAQEIDPNLVGWWTLDEDSGNVALDSTDYWNDGTLYGGPQWVAGRIGGALSLDGTDDYVDCGNDASFDITEQITLSVWVNPNDTADGQHNPYLAKGDHTYAIKCHQWGNIEFFVYSGGWRTCTIPADSSFNGTWHHLAGTFDGTQLKIYLEGELISTTPYVGAIETRTNNVNIGRNSESTGRFYNGLIDDVRVYNRALSEAEIKKIANPEKASTPTPANGGITIQTEVTLQWEAGVNAASHNVYFSDDEQSITEGSAPVTTVSETSHGPLLLELGKTYYWRVDEVEADGTTVSTGEVWSFTVQPLTAYNPQPSDGARYIDADTNLAWSSGFKALSHDVYFGTDETAVANADNSSAEFKGNQTTLVYEPPALAHDTTYYWRIDEQNDDLTVSKGDVWSFRTVPEILVTDPTLVGWWKFDDGQGSLALDWSGAGNHGTVVGDPQWVEGLLNGALDFDGLDDCVDIGDPNILNITEQITLLAWINTNTAANSEDQTYLIKGNSGGEGYGLRHTADNNIQFRISETTSVQTLVQSSFNGVWHHLAGTYDGSQLRLYIDGELRTNAAATGAVTPSAYNVNIAREPVGNRYHYDGLMDDVRIYNRALTEEEIKQAMRGEPLLAWNQSPVNGVVTDVEKVLSLIPLTWSPGDEAVQHDVYFGTDKAAVESADASDATGIYRGRQDANSYTPAEDIVADQTYYWRIDEVNSDETISKGRIWSLIIADYLIVDGFENYDDIDNRIYDTWGDYFVNNTGMTVGHFDPPFAEQSIVHSGRQSMYMRYDNDGTVNEGTDYEQGGTLLYSEAEREWEVAQDWTRKGVESLTLWFRGLPPIYGSFTEGPPITITARGTDIWDTADEFHFAYKRLSGSGSITARVVSITNTDPWAKAGVMIRESLEPGSAQAAVVVTPGQGVSFPRRVTGGTDSESDTTAGIAAPQWVRLTRNGNNFTAEYSADGADWQMLGVPLSIPMSVDVYIGLCLTSHNVDETCTAEFSNVTTDGTGEWQSQDIGIESNIAEQLYVVLEDSAGNSAVVNNSDPAATTIDTWTEWNIPFTDFAGVNLAAVKKMYIGAGDRTSTQPGGAGDLYIDDIGLGLPGPVE